MLTPATASANPPRIRGRMQFRLKSLLLATTLIAVAVGYAFRVQTQELYYDNGALRARLQVRRGLGGMVFYGRQTWYYGTGQKLYSRVLYNRPCDIGPMLLRYLMFEYVCTPFQMDGSSYGAATFWAPDGREITRDEMIQIYPGERNRFGGRGAVSLGHLFDSSPRRDHEFRFLELGVIESDDTK
ncbi:MAG: hypothetical protein K8T25_11310 [Planctomycetia bacterium]|nr:hypothetical protein [Planctomycetia bacterium]